MHINLGFTVLEWAFSMLKFRYEFVDKPPVCVFTQMKVVELRVLSWGSFHAVHILLRRSPNVVRDRPGEGSSEKNC